MSTAAEEAFMETLKATAASSKGKMYIIGPPKAVVVDKDKYVDSDEEKPDHPLMTADTTHVLWISDAYQKEEDRLKEDLECDEKVDAVGKEIDAIKKQKADFSMKLAGALAITRIVSKDSDWVLGNEQKAHVVIKNLCNFWRTVLLKKKDSQLGLGSDASDEEASREALYAVLEQCQTGLDFDDGSDGGMFNNWRPTKDRKKRTQSGRTNSEKSDA